MTGASEDSCESSGRPRSHEDRCASIARPLRVGLVCYPSQGGSGVVATELAHELAHRGHYIHLISYQPPFRLSRGKGRIQFHRVEVPDHPLFRYPPYILALANKIAEVARYEGLDVVHVHYAVPHSVAAVLAREIVAPRGLPVVVTLHGTDVTQTGSDPSIRDAVAWSLVRADLVTAVSDSLAARAREAFGLADVRRIYNFINPLVLRRRADRSLREQYARPEEAVLIHLSNFRPVKNVGDVLRVFAGVHRHRPAVLLLGGDGPESALAHHMARELGVEARVHFLGVQEDVAPLLSIADLFLLPSSDESFGLGALEAMACEVPVIATRTGGLPEVVTDGVTGFLLSVGDVDGMVHACLSALEPARHALLSVAARRRAIDHFSSHRILPQVEEAYFEAIARSSGTEPIGVPHL